MSVSKAWLIGGSLLALVLLWSLMNPPPVVLTSGPAPDFTLPSAIGGESRSLSDAPGKVRLIVFWATWCPPCREEIPALIKAHNQFASHGLEIYGISVDESQPAVMQMHQEIQFNYPILLANASVIRDYGGVSTIPTLFFVDRKGNLAEVSTNPLSETELFERIARLLGDAKDPLSTN